MWPNTGGALKERFEYMTGEEGKGKKRARWLGELMYTLLKKGTEYEVRHFKAGAKGTEALVKDAMSA
jgi:hypothetical protein